MVANISKNVVAVLLVLTIVVSALGTYAVANAQPTLDEGTPNPAQVNLVLAPGPAVSEVSLVIGQPQQEDTQEEN